MKSLTFFSFLAIIFSGLLLASCEKEEIKQENIATGVAVAAPLVPGGAIVSKSNKESVRHDSAKNSISNNK